MLLFGSDGFKKTEILIENYIKLLEQGVSSDEILVIVQNTKMKNEWIEIVKHANLSKENFSLSKFHIYSFFGLCYNKVLENYPILEEKIKFPLQRFFPSFCGLEASTKIFSDAISELVFKGYNSKVNLLHQLLRRQSLITLNALNEEEIKARTRVLKESFINESKLAINMYLSKTLEFRAFDYLRQVNLFSFVYKNVENPYKYVFIDDADEITPALFEYLKFIKKDIKEFFISYDKKGCTRKGYLCAAEHDFEKFLNETGKEFNLSDEVKKAGDEVFENIKSNGAFCAPNLKIKDFVRSDEMIKSLIKDINILLRGGVKYEEILIVTGEFNPFLKYALQNSIDCAFEGRAPVDFIASEKTENNETVSGLLSLARLLVEGDNYRISTQKLKAVLIRILNLDIDDVIKIATEYEADFNTKSIFEILLCTAGKNEKLVKLIEIKEKVEGKKLSAILFELADNFILKIAENKESIKKINELLKQVADFEEIFGCEKKIVKFSNAELLSRLENTIVAENPLSDVKFKKGAIIVATMQKAIDFKLKNKYLFVFDTTNPSWMRQDIGPLYNAWVFQKSWNKKEFTLDDNINFGLDKIARMLRKLFLLNNGGEITLYSSIYNHLGIENQGGIKKFFASEKEIKKPVFKITPRKDQKPVLDYKSGKYAVMAVAGAGKTTIMLALIIKLLEEGVCAENIFVLTYMDSAARTFKERIKAFFPDLTTLPNISTIHGLSMRILRENNNHAHLGLDVDFDIIDEIKRTKLITEIVYNEGGDTQKVTTYERAISAYKNANYKNAEFLKPTFKRIYSQYQRALKELNLIDYDDLLILSLELLKTNSKVREYYQTLAHYVIEDEAQDSSEIQQELINIISRKSGNLIRCGDVNQAITSTFTNSDTKGFKKFIEDNQNCKMNFTARNSTGVINLANKLIKEGLKIAPNAFLEIETKPVQGKNVVDDFSYSMKIFENEEEEKNFLKNEVQGIINNAPKGEKPITIGILTRTNNEVDELSNFLKAVLKNCKVQTKSDQIMYNPVFKAVLGVFNFLSNPMNNNLCADFLQTMHELGFYKDEANLIDEIKKLREPFILSKKDETQFYFDLRYFLQFSVLSPFEAALRAGEFYFKNDKKAMNIAPVSALVAKIFNTEKTFEATLGKMNEIKQRSVFSSIKFYNDDENNEEKNEEKGGEEKKEELNAPDCIMEKPVMVSVLTLHKSKGDEFDHVFIPFLTDVNLGLKQEEIKLKEGTKIVCEVQNLRKTDEELKQEIIDENLRLLYVGITRAKRKLTLCAAKIYKFKGKIRKTKPSYCFELLSMDGHKLAGNSILTKESTTQAHRTNS